MADNTGGDFTSSMTSVTEDDGSLSESDTNDTCSSNFSSVMNSTDYNTDDKLTPSLNSISISKGFQQNANLKDSACDGNKAVRIDHVLNSEDKGKHLGHSFARPFSANPSSQGSSRDKKRRQMKHQSGATNQKNKRWKAVDFDSSLGSASQNRNDCSRPFTFDSPDYKLYTDFSNNNDVPHTHGPELEVDDEDESVESETEVDDRTSDRSYWPNMNSQSWYTARVFDSYWSHYTYAMDWYREHVKFVHSRPSQYSSEVSPQVFTQYTNKKKSNTQERKKKKRARKRRAAKAKQKQISSCDEHVIPGGNNSQEEDETIEMEITEDMMNFFSQSFKHRLERDKERHNEEEEDDVTSRIDIEQAMTGQQGPSSEAPIERPGVKRTAEMKLLFGNGAPMIHGMETAIQMTFDKFTDRHQPKLWPNMPLKMCFT